MYASTSVDRALILCFKNFENLRNLELTRINILVFFIKISCQSKESPFSSAPPFLGKKFSSPPLLPN